jgi:signal transduction histidine kinase
MPQLSSMKKKTKKPMKVTRAKSQKLTKATQSAVEKLKRQARIEAALDRVLTLAMGLKRSSALAEIVGVFQQELNKLKFNLDNCVVWIIDGAIPAANVWLAPVGRNKFPQPAHFEFLGLPYFKQLLNAWKQRKSTWVYELKGQEKKTLDHQLITKTDLVHLPDNVKKKLMATDHAFVSISFYNYGGLHVSTTDPLSKEQLNILNRFSKAFDLCYTRLKDLEKAEAQALEAQIEAALEKVRSRSLAMQSPGELQEVVNILFEKLKELNIGLDTANINAWKPNSKDITIWAAESTQPYDLSYFGHIVQADVWNSYERGDETFSKAYSRQEKDSLMKMLFEQSGFRDMAAERKQYFLNAKGYAVSFAFSKNVSLSIFNLEGSPFSAQATAVLLRFARVFEQAYIRFQDLQKSEAAAREAEIQLSLERVRAAAMAMRKSTDVIQVMTILVEQLIQLGFKVDSCNFNTSGYEGDWHLWLYSAGFIYAEQVHIPEFDHPYFRKTKELHRRRMTEPDFDFDVSSFTKEEKDGFLDHVYSNTIAGRLISEERKKFTYDGVGFDWSVAFSKNTAVTAANYSGIRYTEEQNQILRRFCNAFEQSYRRFLDLQKAETQAREAQTEAALERVRGKAMAMHSTADLTATVSTIFIELRNLGIKPLRFGLGIIERDTRNAALYSASVSDDGGDLQLLGWVVLDDHPILKKIYDGWVTRTDGYFPVLKGDELKTYYEKLRPGFKTPDWHADYEQYGQFYYFEEGSLYAWSEKPIVNSEIPIFKRFTSVLALTYKRYNDLQLSEANARNAVRRSSIDRVRAEIASMRTTGDLERITPLIWNELTKLGVPFIRCGVFIMDNRSEIIHTFLSTPDGKAIGSFNLSYTTPGNIQQALSHWKKNEVYIDHWTEEVFRQFADTLVRQGALTSPDQYLSTIPHGGFYLHFLPFPQGMLYVGNTDELQKDHLQLIQAVTDAFSEAYTRYEDFAKLEAAKQQVDKTLADLKLTQNQLVQSEKMASLGELTAGIAHEIQNPLNFVNNFSEVSNELIDEMVEEVNKGNFDEAKAIAIDVKNNLDKINHHGKRADGIVKNMLQHSQSGSGQKELTDINQLCDEYIRLSYHGLRAKDKSFNAKIETYFDPTLDKINVIPQEIGRVILNLVNNAFYAANEKRNNNIPGFEPKISVTTKKHMARMDDPVGRGKIEISVRDNGTGIPQKVLDKIFQPFFTTKPTGQGTGLGLSLSYDIVKVHNGELKVETKEGQGSKFDVLLPV